MNLFIIGNGFDLAHGLKTSYEDFRHYLLEEYPDADPEEFVMPDVSMMPDGGETIDDETAVSFVMRIISLTEGDKWKDVETTLGILDYSECFDWITYDCDSDGDIDSWKQVYRNEDAASNLVLPMTKITEYFSDWIDTIEISEEISIKEDFVKLINENDDLFLPFNYTETLEQVYGAKNVCRDSSSEAFSIVQMLGTIIIPARKNLTKYYNKITI